MVNKNHIESFPPITRLISYSKFNLLDLVDDFHVGFNMGNNIAEAVNLADEEWFTKIFQKDTHYCTCGQSNQTKFDKSWFKND